MRKSNDPIGAAASKIMHDGRFNHKHKSEAGKALVALRESKR